MQEAPGVVFCQLVVGIAPGSDGDGFCPDGFAALDVVGGISDDVHGAYGIAPGFFCQFVGVAGHVIAIVKLTGKSGVVKVKIPGQVEEIEFQSRSIDTVSCEQTLTISFGLCQEGQEFPGRRYDLASAIS